MPTNEMDERYRTAEEVCDMIHSAANVVRTAINTDDAATKKALSTAAITLLQAAIKKTKESVDASLALEDDDE